MGIKDKIENSVKKFRKWYENSPMEGLEISESNYKYIKINPKGEIVAKHMQEFDYLKEMNLKDKGILLNLATSFIHYHFFEIENKTENKEEERKMIFWKLKTKVPYLKEENVYFDYFKIENRCIVFTLDKDVYEGLKMYIPKGNDFIVNLEIIGVYNYYNYLVQNKKMDKRNNVVLVNMGETITDMLFVENGGMKFIRSFEMGVIHYSKKINQEFENIIDAFSYILSNSYIPQDVSELLDSGKYENFMKIKDVNNQWMKEIEQSIKFYIPEGKRNDYTVVFMRYENYFNNLDLVLANYLNMKVQKVNCDIIEMPYISLMGNILKNI